VLKRMEEVQKTGSGTQLDILRGIDEVSSSLRDDEAAVFKTFVAKCEHTHLLDWPTDLGKNEIRAGINDASTLLCVIHARASL
jgi:hypothetical protein